MKKKYLIICAAVALLLAAYVLIGRNSSKRGDFVSYELDPQKQDLQLYWLDDNRQRFKSIGNLEKWLHSKGQRLVFAMNAGMFKPDYSPQGLFIHEGKVITPLDTLSGEGNFYLKPNGVFYVTADHKAVVCPTGDFLHDSVIRYATQSGPMLLTEGKLHPAFQPGSANVNVRNGVGILANGNAIFVMSKNKINFYDFARFFQELGCRNALYLDGFVSRTYLPSAHWIQTDGDLGVMIGVTDKQ